MTNRRYSFGHPAKAEAAWGALKTAGIHALGKPEGPGPWIVTVLLQDRPAVSMPELDALMESHGGTLLT